jgi:hypothetical protein
MFKLLFIDRITLNNVYLTHLLHGFNCVGCITFVGLDRTHVFGKSLTLFRKLL